MSCNDPTEDADNPYRSPKSDGTDDVQSQHGRIHRWCQMWHLLLLIVTHQLIVSGDTLFAVPLLGVFEHSGYVDHIKPTPWGLWLASLPFLVLLVGAYYFGLSLSRNPRWYFQPNIGSELLSKGVRALKLFACTEIAFSFMVLSNLYGAIGGASGRSHSIGDVVYYVMFSEYVNVGLVFLATSPFAIASYVAFYVGLRMGRRSVAR